MLAGMAAGQARYCQDRSDGFQLPQLLHIAQALGV